MMHHDLTVPSILERAGEYFPRKQVLTRVPGGVHRMSYEKLRQRTCQLANVLEGLGVRSGDRVATFAWNTHRHMEAYWAAPSMGAVAHTVNIRLAPDDLIHIINHAGDQVLLIDEDLVPIVEAVADKLQTVEHYIVMSDESTVSTNLRAAQSYESLMERASTSFKSPILDEHSPAGLCYTSATTGRPKGVMYSHRAIYLHTMMQCMTDFIGLSERDVVLAVVPMFHANCWGVPFSSAMVGADQVLPGVRPDPQAICELIESERVTVALGVPTIWVGVLDHVQRSTRKYDLSSLRLVVSGGSTAPISLIEAYEKVLGVPLLHAYGMTEATPVVSVANLKSHMHQLPDAQKMQIRAKQGPTLPGLDMKVVDESGNQLLWDGQQQGELLLKGPWIASEYYNDPRTAETFIDGWYHTGDVVNVDEDGYIQIVDRTKDIIKSGGEWISSVDLESAIIAHPEVLEAAVIAIPHVRWQERPLACVVPKEGSQGTLTEDEVLHHLEGKFARWWLPDAVVFLDEIPKTSVGKYDKKLLRDRFHQYVPNSSESI